MNNALPPPPIPIGANLADFPFMPLHVARLRKSKAWLMCKRRPELAFYMLNLWTAAWHESPAGSLEDDDDVLADLAMCAPDKWDRVKEAALRGWVKCSDGRLYHPVVAEVVLDAWRAKGAQRQKTLGARIGALQGRLEKAKTEEAKSQMRKELEVLSQEMSQNQSQALSQKPDAKQISLSLNLFSPSTEANRRDRDSIRDRDRENSSEVEPQSLSQSGTVTGLAENRTEANASALTDSPPDPDLDPQSREGFERVKALYPAGLYPESDWLIGEREVGHRVEEGHRWSVIEAGVQRYRDQVIARGKLRGEGVYSPKNFFARREQRWLEEWPLPATKAEQRLSGNVAAAAEAKRRLFGGGST